MSHTLPRWVLRYAQSSCAGQEERTVAPHCRRSAARFTLTLCSGRCPCPLPAVRGQRSVNTLFNAPTPSPNVDVPLRCGCVRRAQSRKKVYHLRLSARYGRRLPERIRFLRCKSGVGLLRRADTRLRSLQKPMLNKFSGNAYGSPVHTLAPQSLAPLPTLHRTSTSPYHKIKPQSEFEARFCLAVVGLPTILKSGSQSAPPKPPLRFGSSSHIGDITAHRPAYSARLKGDFVVSSVGRSVGLGRQPRGKAPNPIKGCITAFSLFQSLTNCGFW